MKRLTKIIVCFLILFSFFITPANAWTDTEKYAKYCSCRMTKKETEAVKEKVSQIIEEKDLKNMDRFTQLVYVCDWVKKNVKYDYEFDRKKRTAYSAITNGLTVCSGYCQLGKEFCDQLEIPCEIVFCQSKEGKKTGETHVMLLVLMDDGLWYYFDITSVEPRDPYFLFGCNTADEVFCRIDRKGKYYDITQNIVSIEDYSTKYGFPANLKESPKVNALRAFLKYASRHNLYGMSYTERPGNWGINNGAGYLNTPKGWYMFTFYYDESKYGPLGCWYN